jgi:hypothetical protein
MKELVGTEMNDGSFLLATHRWFTARKDAARRLNQNRDPLPQRTQGERSVAAAAEIAAIKLEITNENFDRAGELHELQVQLAVGAAEYLQGSEGAESQSSDWKGGALAASWAVGSGRCNIPKCNATSLSIALFMLFPVCALAVSTAIKYTFASGTLHGAWLMTQGANLWGSSLWGSRSSVSISTGAEHRKNRSAEWSDSRNRVDRV